MSGPRKIVILLGIGAVDARPASRHALIQPVQPGAPTRPAGRGRLVLDDDRDDPSWSPNADGSRSRASTTRSSMSVSVGSGGSMAQYWVVLRDIAGVADRADG